MPVKIAASTFKRNMTRAPMTLNRLIAPPLKQAALLERLQAVLELHEACLGAAVGGSLAAGTADSMSDVDLIVYCSAGKASTVLNDLSRVAETCPAVHRLNGRHDAHSVFEKVILEDWSSYEIHVIEPSTRMRLKSPYLEILNRDGYLSSRLSEDKPIGRATLVPYVNQDEGLVWELFCCMKWLRRNEVDFAKAYLSRLGLALQTRREDEP